MSEMTSPKLAQLGWRPFFQQQIGLEHWDYPVCRVAAQHRNRLELLSAAGPAELALVPGMPAITVGDWLLLSPEGHYLRLLERQSQFRRKAPGCAVQDAIARGELNARRLSSYQKLMREQAFNSATLAEKRAREKRFGKMIKSVLSEKKARRS